MRYAPHDYQAYAIDYIETHPIATVFLDMGLGKTSITLTAISNLLFDSFEVHRVLVIAPLITSRTSSAPWLLEQRLNAKPPSCDRLIFTSSTEKMSSGSWKKAASRSPLI